ncbi:TadE/TadG family type IV pilus assembly protein [Phaeobacter sp. HF9A]|uniref:TadE/TadG family type IV pilus assembly protein n=1 Tax=Phaeobacter sp. HF9A TaxID=2721561 RepID=UPI001431400A|nr:TadE family protein [Phaeobacter sp. HF9A]NIZ13464.1 pilus assembly protein [Phaeobacter sp. HF9A]
MAALSRIRATLRRFRRRQDGAVTIEFVIIFPVMLLILFSTVELGVINLRQIMLERAMDMTVREIRLGTGGNMQHDEIRDRICDYSGTIRNCATSLKLEMVQLDPFNWTSVDATPDCIESIEESNPLINFKNGGSNDLMFLRACLNITPLFPGWGLGKAFQKDGDGRIHLYASSAFVQEPK